MKWIVRFMDVLSCLVILWYFVFLLPKMVENGKAMRLLAQRRSSFQALERNAVQSGLSPFGFPPNDITDSNGLPLLSWRVAFLQEISRCGEYGDILSRFNFQENWLSPQNLEASKQRPNFYFYPYYLEKSKPTLTCMVLVKEIADWKRSGNYGKGHIQDKALVILIDPEYAVPWTAPTTDVSWQDLANGKIKPFVTNGYIHYLKAWDLLPETGAAKCPESYEEWENLCGVPSWVIESHQNKSHESETTTKQQ